MKNIAATLFLRDLRTLSRDPLSAFIALIPLLIGLLIRMAERLLFPVILDRFGLNLSPAIPAVTALMLPMAPMMAGWTAGFLTLDERDQGLTDTLRTVPVHPLLTISVRLGWTALLSFATGALMLLLIRPEALTRPVVWAILAAGTLTAPPVALLLIRFGKNKVQGLTLAKGISVLIAAPLTYMLLPGILRYTGGIVPLFWTSTAWLETATGNVFMAVLYLFIGVIFHGFLITLGMIRHQNFR